MARIVDLDEHELRIRFTGLDVLRTRRRSLHVPRTAIRGVSKHPVATARWRAGTRRIDGRRVFIACGDPEQAVTVDLDRGEAGYDALVLEV